MDTSNCHETGTQVVAISDLGQKPALFVLSFERELRQAMQSQQIKLLQPLPGSRPSQTPTIEQLLRLFENRDRHELYDKDRVIKSFAEPLSPVQSQILNLLKIEPTVYLPKK